jgi:hypothetical protein
MGKRKKKWPNGIKPKLHQGGLVNESQKLSMGNVIPKIELAGRRFTTRLIDSADPYNLRRKY